MLKRRLIAVLILRDGCVVQSVRFQHTNVIHYDPVHAVDAFNHWAVDEIVFLNVEREPDGRERFAEVLERVSAQCFVPLTAGGWITDEEYARSLLRKGADKLVFNSALHDDPAFVAHLVRRFGSQCIVASIDAKRDAEGKSGVVIDRGRRATGLTPLEAAKRAEELNLYLAISFVEVPENAASFPRLKELMAPIVDEVFHVHAANQSGQMLNLPVSPYLPETCQIPFNQVNITREGYLRACCNDYQNALAIDDLTKMSLGEAWNGVRFRELRRRHLEDRLEGTLCYTCIKGKECAVRPIAPELGDWGPLK